MFTQCRSLFSVLVASLLLSATPSQALQKELFATDFSGDDATVRVLLNEVAGNIEVTLSVVGGIGDLRGFFLNLDNFALLGGLKVTGADVTKVKLKENKIKGVGRGASVKGKNSPCPCDLGIAIGTPGIKKDDILSTTFVLDANVNLALDDLSSTLFGVSLANIANFAEDTRKGSSKLSVVPVPEPSSAWLLALGLSALGYKNRARRSA